MHLRHRWLVTLAATAAMCAGAMAVNGASPKPASPKKVLVELFTSQGCSSCPPTDYPLGELARSSDVVALGFQISYWDRLGWKDPFSNKSST